MNRMENALVLLFSSVVLIFCLIQSTLGCDESKLDFSSLNPTPLDEISYRNRSEITRCAREWTDKKIPYCQCNGPEECCGHCPYCGTTRCDCSGFVSNCWGVKGYTTRSLPEIAHEIKKDELKPGDVMLYVGHHVAFFYGWATSSWSEFHCIQEAGCHTSDPKYAFESTIKYPFNWGDFKPYRFKYVRED